MLSAVLSTAIGYQSIQTVSNDKEKSPKDSHIVIKDVAKMANLSLYAPDASLKGYTLKSIELGEIPTDAKFGNANSKIAVRMVFLNKSTSSVIELIQRKTTASFKPVDHLKWLFSSKIFDTGLSPESTFVAQKIGANDIGLQGGLISEPSAKIVLSKLVKVNP